MLTKARPPVVAQAPSSLRSGLRRVAGLSASLVGTQALTSVLGLVFWTLAARRFSIDNVGVAGAAVAMMMLLSSLGSLGLGTLLIARLPLTDVGSRRLLVRTSLLVAGLTSGLLGIIAPLAAVFVFGARNLHPLVASPLALLGFAVGTGLMSVVLVLDQAVLTIGVGALQLERNVLASTTKIVALLALSGLGATGGLTVFLAWAIGNLVSLPLVSWRTRGGRVHQTDRRWVDRRVLSGLGRMAASHHALNTTLQAALQILPIMVTVLLSARENAYFNSAVLVSGFVFALPYAIAISLFASSAGSERDVVSRMKITLPFSLAVGALAYLVMLPLAGTILGVFGASYASEGVTILRILALAGLPFVIKDHYIAVRRVQGRTTDALRALGGLLVLELIGAAFGAHLGGSVGLGLGWFAVLVVEAAVLTVPLVRAWRTVAPRSMPDTLVAIEDSAVADHSERPGRSSVDLAASLAIADASSLGGSTSGVAVSGLITEVREANPAPAVARPTRRRRLVPALRRNNRGARLARQHRAVNLFGPLVLLMACGVFLLAIAANRARLTAPTGLNQALWIAGLVVIIAPAAVRVLWSRTSAGERTALAVAVPVILQVSRLVLNPVFFSNHDELLHTNTLRQIDETSHLFSLNPLLPVSGFYPGLEMVTDSIHRITGLSTFSSSWIVLLAARVVITLAIIGLVRKVAGSSRAAAIASLLYVCNPQYLFFNSQYSYQTLALPLAVFTAYAFAVRNRERRSGLLLPVLGLAAVTVTHHLTAMLLVGAFLLWWLVELVLSRRTGHRAERRGLLVMWLSGLAMSAAAALNPGSPVGSYLTEIATSSSRGVTGLAEGQQAKQLFADSAGSGPAGWEQVLLISSVAICGLSLLLVVFSLRRTLRARNALGLVLVAVALLYPVIPAGHLTIATAEVGDRASGFVFLGLAAVLAGVLARLTIRGGRAVLLALTVTVVFLGSVVLGAGPTARQLPGPYLIEADSRSIDADNLAAADWMSANLSLGNHLYADRDGGLLAAAVGGQFTVRHLSTGIDASPLLLDPEFTPTELDLIRQGQLNYLVVDTRLSQGLPHLDVYIESGEFEGRTRTGPVPAAALTKYSSINRVSLIYSNGSINIYDLRGLRHAR